MAKKAGSRKVRAAKRKGLVIEVTVTPKSVSGKRLAKVRGVRLGVITAYNA